MPSLVWAVIVGLISIHALLAESDLREFKTYCWDDISIHALLAESDAARTGTQGAPVHFYPRSPCGERRKFRPTCGQRPNFYPRSPCGERLSHFKTLRGLLAFLSTLSLRRATIPSTLSLSPVANFYPRSPCGERQRVQVVFISQFQISIHALLAESDHALHAPFYPKSLFLSTLSLRRATRGGGAAERVRHYFYPRSPCGERLQRWKTSASGSKFLSTLSLRRATRGARP